MEEDEVRRRTFERNREELRKWAKKKGLRKERGKDEYSVVFTGEEEFKCANFHFSIKLLRDGVYNARVLANGFSCGSPSARIFGLEGAYEDDDMEICLANVLSLTGENSPDRCLELVIRKMESMVCLLTGAEGSGWLRWRHYGVGSFIADLKELLRGKSVREICWRETDGLRKEGDSHAEGDQR